MATTVVNTTILIGNPSTDDEISMSLEKFELLFPHMEPDDLNGELCCEVFRYADKGGPIAKFTTFFNRLWINPIEEVYTKTCTFVRVY